MIDRGGPEWTRSAFWFLGAAYATVLFALLALFALGLAFGPPPGDPPAPVEFDAPPEDVLRDATARLRARDYAAAYSLRFRNRTTGDVTGGTFARIRFENSRNRRRGTVAVWWLFGDPGVRPDETVELWTSGYGVGFGRARDEAGWQQGTSLDDFLPPQPSPGGWDLSDRATYEVRAENGTHYVVRATDPAQSDSPSDVRDVATAVVAKRPDPHLRSFTLRDVDEQRTTVFRVAVGEYGTATAPRPPRTPSVTIQELLGRSFEGLQRLF